MESEKRERVNQLNGLAGVSRIYFVTLRGPWKGSQPCTARETSEG